MARGYNLNLSRLKELDRSFIILRTREKSSLREENDAVVSTPRWMRMTQSCRLETRDWSRNHTTLTRENCSFIFWRAREKVPARSTRAVVPTDLWSKKATTFYTCWSRVHCHDPLDRIMSIGYGTTWVWKLRYFQVAMSSNLQRLLCRFDHSHNFVLLGWDSALLTSVVIVTSIIWLSLFQSVDPSHCKLIEDTKVKMNWQCPASLTVKWDIWWTAGWGSIILSMTLKKLLKHWRLWYLWIMYISMMPKHVKQNNRRNEMSEGEWIAPVHHTTSSALPSCLSVSDINLYAFRVPNVSIAIKIHNFPVCLKAKMCKANMSTMPIHHGYYSGSAIKKVVSPPSVQSR